ncbi:dihydrolipoamide acetyltransferase family protein [Micromonospora noduli]|uniref:Dihydrolipoamide acetyltransferase component of pyruvate dehydrogenase complex n=1 Tax=Micromonospora noduli TaxID=709876 RepID=A0A328N5W3_9ACTN|nr:dihydrolipoamide acetyltransferase family protein [Micromonospora noduli]KAB1926817.1 2-oxo acid dehydrogenase subunit E2 [Micromonospora noduli]RAN97534.1 Dihydrolipoyllysine-residue acetyltransferase [Micromonospora noduli]RAO03660.1 Dihydrolipoyllysine-residue acetyltransferase [Micromonospora noduli]RAO15973.1 Dihydrolipoyllysine-residue acetyltransferase [Micromonospora noduli]RAO17353.1 Dihydrolipoyllysine-residue acetyltransferase [Micromonospora noduli]
MSRIKTFNLPDLGEGLTEGEILAWLVKVGDTIELNQPIVEVETAKAAVEIPAKWAGQVQAIHHPEGTTVEVGTPIIAIDTDPGAGPLEAPSTTATPSGDLPTPSAASLAAVEVAPAEGMIEPGLIGGAAPGGRTAVLVGYGPRTTAAKRRPRKGAVPAQAVAAPAPTAPTPPPVVTPVAAPAQNGRAATATGGVLAKPPVRKLAKDLGVDLGTLTGSGPLGSITREDVQQAASGASVVVAEPIAATTAPSFGADREQRIPVKGVRKLTAENMSRSAFTAPHVTEFLTVDVTRAMKALDRLRGRREWRDVRVSPLLLVAKAVLLAVQRHPMVNSTWAGDEIVVKEYVNLGIAAATERGLIVPNVKDAGRLSLRELADALTDLVQTAKSGRTSPAAMSGGTLTITNVGVFGVDTGTPILPPGESAILAFGAVREMPWVHKGKVKVRQVTTLGLSFDHRIIDGELGSKFLRDVGDFLTDPEAALLAWT